MAKIILSCGFSSILCQFLRKSTIKKGQRLVQHIFDVTETRYEEKNDTVISGKCVRQASIHKAPYNVELILDQTRTVSSALCSCIAGVQGMCKHAAALIQFVNSERIESQTDTSCKWQAPTSKGRSLYPKGETIDKILRNPSPTEQLKFQGPSKEQIQDQTALLEKFGLKNSTTYKMTTAPIVHPEPNIVPDDLSEWVARLFEPNGNYILIYQLISV